MEPNAPAPPKKVSARPAPTVLGRWLVPLGAAVSLGWPAVSPGTALLAGVAIALVIGNPYLGRTRPLAKSMLAWAVVGLGAGMNLGAVLRIGAHGVVYTVAGLALCFSLGALLARLLSVQRRTALLITTGTAICGGSAIAAVVPVIGATDEETSVAMGTVFLLNAVALFLFPAVGHLLRLSQTQFGFWAALVTFVPALVPAGGWVAAGARRLLVATLFFIGANLSRDALRKVGARPLLLGLSLWAVIGSLTLGAILIRLIA